MDKGLTSAERTIPAAFHNLNNAANFLMLISNADDVRPELRELALAYALALGTVHNTVSDLRTALTHIERYEQTQAGSHGDEALLPPDHWNLPRAMQQEARDALGLPAMSEETTR